MALYNDSKVLLPGLVAIVSYEPTAIDPDGCDGIYVAGYIFTDWRLFQTYMFATQRLFFMFSVH